MMRTMMRTRATAALGVSGKPDIPYFTPSAQIAISAVPRSAGTAQALHTVSRTWLRGGSPHRILKKLPVRHAALLRRQGVSVYCTIVKEKIIYH